MPLDRVLARLRQRITPTRRAAFLACFIAGYLIHLFAFTNIIPNSDGLSRVFDPQQMTVSGRCLPRCPPSSAFSPWCFSPLRRRGW